MKKLLLFLLICIPFLSGARERNVQLAREIAYKFLESGVRTKSSNVSLDLVYTGAGMPQTRSAESSAPTFYVFDNEIGPGFVIVSGDDAVQQILAYSFDSNFKADNVPSNLAWWLDTMNSQVETLREAGEVASDAGLIPGTTAVLYETAKWSQSSPYNDQCPGKMYLGKFERAVTGCGPTAIAIVLRYKEYPRAGTGTTTEYTISSSELTVNARELGQEYVWGEMPLYTPHTKAWTDVQKEQVSRLIADIGAAAHVSYGLDATSIFSSSVVPALTQYFGFDKSAYLAQRNYYMDKDWLPLVKQEIKENGPVIYSGSSSDTGHMFVLDGYDTNNYVHVNWGWGGSSDGFYSLSSMSPGTPDAKPGSSAHNKGYNWHNDVVVKLIPDQGGEETMRVTFFNASDNGESFKGLTVKARDNATGLPSLVNIGGIVNRGSKTYYDVKVRLVMADMDMNVYKVFWEDTIEEFHSSSSLCYAAVPVTDYGTIGIGYSLIVQYFNQQENRWMKITADKTAGYESIALADEYSIEESTTFRYENSTGTITLTTKKGVEVKCFRDGVDYAVVGKDAKTFVIETASMKAGVYTIGLSKDSEYHELRFIVGSKKEEKK